MKRLFLLTIGALCMAITLAAQQTKELYLLHTSDTHSRIEPLDMHAADRDAGKGGVVRRATFITQFREQHPATLVLDCGDYSQGTPYYNFYHGELEARMIHLMHYDAIAIGNHEFDFGMENLARLMQLAGCPSVCANYEVTGTPLEGLVKPYIIIERAGLRIGLFGLGAKLEGLVQADKCEGVIYKDPIATAQDIADTLRENERCDVVLCLSHLGVTNDETLAKSTQGIDAILGGHSHTVMEEPAYYPNAEGKEVPVFHTGRNGAYVGVWKLTLED